MGQFHATTIRHCKDKRESSKMNPAKQQFSSKKLATLQEASSFHHDDESSEDDDQEVYDEDSQLDEHLEAVNPVNRVTHKQGSKRPLTMSNKKKTSLSITWCIKR